MKANQIIQRISDKGYCILTEDNDHDIIFFIDLTDDVQRMGISKFYTIIDTVLNDL